MGKEELNINYFVADDLMKSEGVDKTRSLVFSLDTMESYLVTKRRRYLENIPINSFLIKLQLPGRTTNNLYIKDTYRMTNFSHCSSE